MHIKKPAVQLDGDEASYRVEVESMGEESELWFSLDGQYADLISERSDAALLALLIPAMARGEDVTVEGKVSERLHYHLSGPYQKILQIMMPRLHKVAITAERLVDEGKRAPGVATGFSGGVDSFCLLADHFYDEITEGFRITHLLFNNVGSHGRGAEKLFRERYDRLAPAVERMGLPFVAVDSNVGLFYDGFSFQQTHTARNAAVALMMQRGIGRYIYASTFDYELVRIYATYDMSYGDPVSLPLLSTGSLDAISAGSEYRRVDKTARIVELQDAREYLDVCVRGDRSGNCSSCWKCLRTLLALEILGALDGFGGVFDVKEYFRHRSRFIEETLQSSDPLLVEIRDLAEERGFEFPRLARFKAHRGIRGATRAVDWVLGTSKKNLRRIKRRVAFS